MPWWSHWWPALGFAAIIFAASSISQPPPPPGGLTDKHEHFAAYALLSALVLRGLARGQWRGVTWRTAVAAAVLAALYGLSDEFHQSFVPMRKPSWLDVAADAIGAAAGAAALWAWAIMRRRG